MKSCREERKSQIEVKAKKIISFEINVPHNQPIINRLNEHSRLDLYLLLLHFVAHSERELRLEKLVSMILELFTLVSFTYWQHETL